jgi:hypothetical protein
MTVQRPPTLLTTRITGGESPTEVCQSPAFGTHVTSGNDAGWWSVSTHCPHRSTAQAVGGTAPVVGSVARGR